MKYLPLYILLLCSFLKSSSTYSQNFKIREVKLSDTVLKNEIDKYIIKRKKEYRKFDSLGYVTVSLDYYNRNAIKKELSFVYLIKDQYFSLKIDSRERFFPLYYTYVNDKLVFLHNYLIQKKNKISKRYRKRFIKKVNKTLGERQHLLGYNSKGEKVIDDKIFFKEEEYNLHGGIKLKIFANDSISIIKNSHVIDYK